MDECNCWIEAWKWKQRANRDSLPKGLKTAQIRWIQRNIDLISVLRVFSAIGNQNDLIILKRNRKCDWIN